MIEEADLSAVEVLPRGTSLISAFFYGRLPELVRPFKTYTLYRLECGMRSTLVLGFVGLPTIGFHLESYFKQGHYAQAAALLGAFYVLIGTRRIWARPATLPFLILGSILLLPEAVGGGSAWSNLARFIGHDIVPAPLRGHDLALLETWASFGAWLQQIVIREVLPGVAQTLVLSQIALVATAIMALAAFPAVSRRFAGRFGQVLGRVWLVVVRSTPEYMLAYVLLQLLGPSMLPAIIALSLHNAGIVGYLWAAMRTRSNTGRMLRRASISTLTRRCRGFMGSSWPICSTAGRSSCGNPRSSASSASRRSATTSMRRSPSCASTSPSC